MRYRPNTEIILKNLSFSIAKGEKVGVVGRTGAGKSTIANVLTRICELESGSILIDGLDISKIGL
jgi:ABC-type multidrug transport system fused ATPase/permease subunit